MPKPASEIRASLVSRAREIQRLKAHLTDDLGENEQLDRIKKEYREAKIKRLVEGYIRGRSKYIQACRLMGCAVEPLPEEV